VITAALALLSKSINAYLALRRRLLQHEIRLRWGSRPRVVVRDEGGVWRQVLNDRWLPSATERTLVLSTVPDLSRPWPLEWRLYQEWGPDYKFLRSPVALIVHKNGRVERIEFAKAMTELAAGDDTLLRAQLDDLERLSHWP
jgi:hypothetical protein